MTTAPDWKALGLAAFRDFVTDGSPVSGVNQPAKSEIRAFIEALATFVPSQQNVKTGTSYTLVLTDNGTIIPFNAATTVTVSVPDTLPIGWSCTLLQLGGSQADGLVTVQATGGADLASNADSIGNLHRTIDGWGGMMSLLVYANADDTSAEVLISGVTRV